MYKNGLSLNVGKVEKLILHLDSDQSKNQIDWHVAEDLSFHKIWSKSVNNPVPDQSHSLTKCSLSEGFPLIPPTTGIWFRAKETNISTTL